MHPELPTLSKTVCLNFVALLFFATHFHHVKAQQNGFRDFVTSAMKNYSEWMRSSGADPTPMIPYSIDLRRDVDGWVNITGYIRDLTVNGHSNHETVIQTASIDQRIVQVGFKFLNYNVTGDYQLDGTMNSVIPVGGAGRVRIDTVNSAGNVLIQGFRITDDGFIDMTPAFCTLRMAFYGDPTFNFENLEHGDREDTLMSIIFTNYQAQINQWFPPCQEVKSYLKQVFEKTPISEMKL